MHNGAIPQGASAGTPTIGIIASLPAQVENLAGICFQLGFDCRQEHSIELHSVYCATIGIHDTAIARVSHLQASIGEQHVNED